MLNNDLTSSDSRLGQNYSFTSVVKLQKDPTGIFYARPAASVNRIRNQEYPVKMPTKRLAPRGLALGKTYRRKHPSVRHFATMPEYYLGTLDVLSDLQDSKKREDSKPGQRVEEPSMLVLVTSVSSAKRLNKLICMLLTAGGILLISKRKRLTGLATNMSRLFFATMKGSKK